MECYRHPSAPAAARCPGCGRPVCAACAGAVEAPVRCAECAAAPDEEPSAARAFPTPPPGVVVVPPGASLEDLVGIEGPVTPLTPIPLKIAGCGPGDYFRVLAAACLAGAVGAFLWGLLAVASRSDLVILCVLLGGAVGGAVRLAAGERRGALLPWIGVAVGTVSVLASYVFMAYQQIMASPEHVTGFQAIPPAIRIPLLVVGVVRNLGVIEWGLGIVAVIVAGAVARGER